jgi:hypothetical protein
MTHIEIKKYFDKQRGIAMNPQTVQLPPDIGDIAKTVFWEKNQYVLHNPKIEPSQIIAKTSTSKFPAGATTIRFSSIKDRIATAYVYGKGQTQTYGSGSNQYTYVTYSSKLTVTFPNRKANNGRRDWGYTYNGDLPSDLTRHDLDITLDYCENVMKDFLNL